MNCNKSCTKLDDNFNKFSKPYQYHLLPKQTKFKNECINVFPTIDRLSLKGEACPSKNGLNVEVIEVKKDEDSNKCEVNCKNETPNKAKISYLNYQGLDIGSIVQETQKRKLEKSDLTSWRLIDKDDINNVWSLVSSYIRKRLELNKAVHLPNLGTFGVFKREIDMGNLYIPDRCYPYFSVDLNFAKLHNLNYLSRPINNQIPCSNINYLELSKTCVYPRDILQRCVEQSILAVSNKIRENNDSKLVIQFPTLGALIIKQDSLSHSFKSHREHERIIKMEFCPNLIKNISKF